MGTAIPRPYREDSATTAMQIEGSLQFNESVECYMTRTATSGNRRTFTMSCWYRRTVNDSSDQTILFGGPNGDDTYPLTMNSDNMIMVLHYQGGVTYKIAGPQLRDYAGWVHLVSVHDTPQATASNRLKLYMNGVQITNFSTESYPSQNYETSMNENGVQQRIGFQVSANAFELDGYLTEFNFLDGMALGPGYFGFTDPLTGTWKPKKFKKPGQPLGTTVNDGKQWSATIGDFTNGANVFNGNMGNQGYANNTGVTTLTTAKFQIKNNLRLYNNFRSDGTYNIIINGVSINVPGTGTDSTAYRWTIVDLTSADTTGSSERVRLETPITVTSLQYYISQVSGNSLRAIEVDGVVMVDSTTTILDFGTNGYYLPMDGSGTTVGSDQSGKGNDWTLTNLSSSNVCSQSPSGIVYSGKQRRGGSMTTYNATLLPANYCTLDQNNMGGSITLKNAATTVDSSGGGNISGTHLIPPNSGKYFWDCQVGGTMAGVIGIAEQSVANTSALSQVPTIRGYGADGKKYYGDTGASYGSVFSNSGWVSVLFDSDQRTLEFYYNGVSQGVAFTAGANGIVDGAYYTPCFHVNSMDVYPNFGATKAWVSATPPEGYKTLCDASLSQSTEILYPKRYVDTVLYTGNGATNRNIYGLNFQPDFMWFSPRNEANWKTVFDSVRGDAKSIYTNSSWTQESLSNTGGVPLRDGFTVGYNSGYSSVFTNKNAVTYVAWCLKAGGNKNTFNKDDIGYASAAAAGLTAGTDPSTDVLGSSVGTKQGFSIIKYNNPDGGTHEFPHGLTETPQIMFSKKTSDTGDWYVHTTALDGSVDYGFLNGTNSFSASSRTFSATEAPMINSSGTYIAYLWHSVPGFSKIGMWTGNQNADGPFSNLGFKPAIVIIKNTDFSDAPWYIFDSARDTDNPIRFNLNPNNAEIEEDDTNGTWDWASNGMKMTSNGTYPNQSTHKILYMAWAQNPFANLYGGQSNIYGNQSG